MYRYTEIRTCLIVPELTQSEIQEQKQRLKMHDWAKTGITWFGPKAKKAWLSKSWKYKRRLHIESPPGLAAAGGRTMR
jgi:hypothetical protein